MASERALEGLVEEIGQSAFLLTAFHDASSCASGSAARRSSPNQIDRDGGARYFEVESSGKVRAFGVSNHTPRQIDLLKTAVTQPIIANQV